LVFSSDESGDDMILRRTLEGAEKCALRDLRRLLDTEVEYFIVPHYEKGRPRVRCRLKAFRATRGKPELSFFLPKHLSLQSSIFRPHFPFVVTTAIGVIFGWRSTTLPASSRVTRIVNAPDRRNPRIVESNRTPAPRRLAI
jgi:hypothetical protein